MKLYGKCTGSAADRMAYLVRNGDGGVTVLGHPFPGAVGFAELPDTPASREAGALPAEEALEQHWAAIA